MEDLERYTRTGHGADLPPLPPAAFPPEPGADAARTARLALVRWYRHLHLPGVRGLPEYRAALHLAGLLEGVPPGLPALPAPLRVRRAGSVPRRPRPRWLSRHGGGATARDEEETVALGPARIDQLLFLMERFEEHRDFGALETVLALQSRWLKGDTLSARERAALLTDRARLLLTLGELGSDRSWPEEGERCASTAAEQTARHLAPGDPHLVDRLLLKARCAALLHDPVADPSGLERAVRDLRRAVEAAGQRTPVPLHPARYLVTVLIRRYETTGSEETLAEALAAARDLVRATDPEDRRAREHRQWLADLRTKALPRLGAATVDAVLDETPVPYAADDARWESRWRTADDSRAAPAERRRAALALVEAVPGRHEDRPGALVLAAETELEHWTAGSDEASPGQARVWAVRAADATPPGHRLAGRALTVLAETTLHRAAESEPEPDEGLADEAVATARRTAEALPPDDPDTPRCLDRLAVVLSGAARMLSDDTLLPESLGLRRRALALTPADEPFRPFRMSMLADALGVLAEETENAELAEEALALDHEAADALPEDHPQKHELLFNLASQFVRGRGGGDGAVQRLAEAERLYRRGLARLPAGHPDQPRFTSSVAQVLHLRYEETGDRRTLADAVALARDALARTPSHDPFRIARTLLLARVCTALHDLDGAEPADAALRAEALGAWEAVAADPHLPEGSWLEAQEQSAALSRAGGDPERALVALEAALARVPRLARRSLAGPVRKGTARRAPELAVQAAIAAVEAGRPTHAVDLLEKGRAILYGQAMTAWRHRSWLRSIDPEAADRLEKIDAELAEADFFANVTTVDVRVTRRRASGRADEESVRTWDPRPGYAARTRRLAAERDRILDRPARHPDLVPPTDPQLPAGPRARVAGSPVVFVLTHRTRGDALLVPADPAHPVVHVPLPGLAETAVRDRIAVLETAVRDALDPRAGHDRRLAAQSELHDVLAWLWDEAASPVLSRIPAAAGPGRPRLWWCPVGPLVRLPLHVAGRHPRGASRPADGSVPPTVIDRVIPSYTPTLAALAHSLRDAPHPAPEPTSPLVVAVPDTPRLPPLPQARREAETVCAALPGSRLLIGAEADLATVEAALRRHALVHFACHGDNDSSLGVLRGGGLHLAGGETLTAAHLLGLRLDQGALAVLSACSTAEAHPVLPDEPMHLAAAFQLAGFRSVIGTLWRAPDTPRMAEELYGALTAGGTRPPDPTASAEALNTAQRALRDAYPDVPTRWASYLHTGA
ncbi:CHAT domain-containing protein [Streptomyces nodosus]